MYWDSIEVNFDNSWIGEDGKSMLTVTQMDEANNIINIVPLLIFS